MTHVHIEPSHERRPYFALWCLAQTPQIQTASATGYDVPTELYPHIPAELLEGAYADGFPVDGPRVPAEEPQAAVNPVEAPVDVSGTVDQVPVRRPRKRSARSGSRAAERPVSTAPVLQSSGYTPIELLGGGE